MSSHIRRKSAQIALAALSAVLFTHLAVGSIGNPNDDPAENQAFGIGNNLGKWTNGDITWVYNSTNAPNGWTDDNDTVARFQAAIDEWEGVCDVSFTFGGIDDTAVDTDDTDNTVVFNWALLGGAAGQAGPNTNNSTAMTLGRWNYYDGFVRMAQDVLAFGGGDASAQERNRIAFHATAVHELGHLLGLGHSDRPDSIMYANPYNSITHVKADDVQACRTLYGYSDVHDPRSTYTPPANGVASYDPAFFFFTSNTAFPNNIGTMDDGTRPDSEQLWLRYQNLTGGYMDTLTQVIVDPNGYVSTQAQLAVAAPAGGGFGIATFGLLREIPGVWTVYGFDSTGLVVTLQMNVMTNLPVVNEPPDATFTFTENFSTRNSSITTNVTGDNEGDVATIIWHIPGQMPFSVTDNLSTVNDNQTPTFTIGQDHEVFAEVNDDAPRYQEDLPNNIGPAGPGFHRLYRYFSSKRNIGPDMDGDNSSDLFWRNNATGRNWLYSLNGNFIRKSELINTENDPNWEIVAFADFNGDGKTDVLWRNSVTGVNWMYLMNGSTIVTSALVNVEGDQNWKVAATGDFNGDGNADIFWRNMATGKNWIYFMNGNMISNSVFVNTEGNQDWQVAGAGDYNADGMDDIVWRNSANGKNWLYPMNGAAIMNGNGMSINTEGDQNWKIVGTGDYDGDGMADILWRKLSPPGKSRGRNWVYLMNGNMIQSSLLINHEANFDWQIVANGDFNADGKCDIFWRNSTTGRNWMYQMDGATIMNSVLLNTEGDQNWQIVDF